jgi:hypothetical protein
MVPSSKTLLSAAVGGVVLRNLDAAGISDAARLHQLEWWQELAAKGSAMFKRDALSTASEMVTTRGAATRAGRPSLPQAGSRRAKKPRRRKRRRHRNSPPVQSVQRTAGSARSAACASSYFSRVGQVKLTDTDT